MEAALSKLNNWIETLSTKVFPPPTLWMRLSLVILRKVKVILCWVKSSTINEQTTAAATIYKAINGSLDRNENAAFLECIWFSLYFKVEPQNPRSINYYYNATALENINDYLGYFMTQKCSTHRRADMDLSERPRKIIAGHLKLLPIYGLSVWHPVLFITFLKVFGAKHFPFHSTIFWVYGTKLFFSCM